MNGPPPDNGPLKNDQGEWSGAKAVLAVGCVLAGLWLVRDLCLGWALTDQHAALLGVLLVIGLVNRISARGHFKLRLGKDGAEIETREGRHD